MTTYPYPFDPPTITGFQSFITTVMGISAAALPPTNPQIGYAFNIAMLTANQDLQVAGTYTPAVYNLAGSLLLNFAQDTPPSTYFADLRAPTGYDLVGFVPGVVAASGDQGTSTSLLVPDAYKGLTTSDLQRLKDPYGRQYVMFAQEAGPSVWGLS